MRECGFLWGSTFGIALVEECDGEIVGTGTGMSYVMGEDRDEIQRIEGRDEWMDGYPLCMEYVLLIYDAFGFVRILSDVSFVS